MTSGAIADTLRKGEPLLVRCDPVVMIVLHNELHVVHRRAKRVKRVRYQVGHVYLKLG